MQLNSVVQDVMTKSIPIKNGPRAGTMGIVYTLMVDGKKINYGFTKPPQKGEFISVDISDTPNRFGEYELQGSRRGTASGNGGAQASGNFQKGTNQMDKGFPIPKNNHAISICRQNALTHAVNIVEHITGTEYLDIDNYADEAEYDAAVTEALTKRVNRVLEVANVLASYTTGHVEDLEE